MTRRPGRGHGQDEAGLVYTADSVRAVTVAAWVKADRQDLDDIERAAADIGEALRYGMLVAVERLLLDGAPADADGDAVPGILDDPFVPTVTATNLDGAIGQMKAQLISTGVRRTSPRRTPVTIEAEESRTGSDGHPSARSRPGPHPAAALVESTALGDGQVLVGDSRVGARLGVRQGIWLVAGAGQRRPRAGTG